MSGHNKWSKIKHKKAITDSKRSKVFSKLVKLIQIEAKQCGGDIESPSLRTAIEKARKANMPKDNIDRAIKKASETADNIQYVQFEAYGPGGVGMIITGFTENNNRTSAEIKHILSKNESSLGAQNSVAWNFTKNKESGEWEPNSTIKIGDEKLEELIFLVDLLDDHDDVQDVFTNAA